jgi:hypothetical protein
MSIYKTKWRGSNWIFSWSLHGETITIGQKVIFCCSQVGFLYPIDEGISPTQMNSIIGHNIGANIIKWHYCLGTYTFMSCTKWRKEIWSLEFKIISNIYSTTSHFVKDVLLTNNTKFHFRKAIILESKLHFNSYILTFVAPWKQNLWMDLPTLQCS